MSMYYSIRHKTRYRYNNPVSESVTEVRMQPRNEGFQRCLRFELTTSPRARIMSYRDYHGNAVHHFDVPGQHRQLVITAEAVIVFTEPPPLPQALAPQAWQELDNAVEQGDFWDMLVPSRFARPSELLAELARELAVERRDDPLSVLRNLNAGLYNAFSYAPQSTSVDSPIDDALAARKGVCQDFVHIMITLVRGMGIPCRYVSGYLFHRAEDQDRSEEDATHAWAEAFLPGLGWVGFDPTNNLLARERHIRTAIGRDYADVPPTRGIFRGSAKSELDVGVKVVPTEAPPSDEELLPTIMPAPPELHPQDDTQWQQQQQ